MTIRERLRRPFVTTPGAERVDLAGRHIIVTGCSLGSLGHATAQQLARWGATVIVTTRRGTRDVVAALNAELAQPAAARMLCFSIRTGRITRGRLTAFPNWH